MPFINSKVNVKTTAEQQEELISFLKDRKAINMIAPGTAGFDLDEMPWQDDEVNKEIVIPWLKQFAKLIRQMTSIPPIHSNLSD